MKNRIKILEIMKNILKTPLLFVILYLLVIPLFALLFYLLEEPKLIFLDSIYFSIVTITTLGYGDIVPHSLLIKILVSLEAILGIVLIGLFLNALSHRISYRATKKEKEVQLQKDIEKQRDKFTNFNKLVNQSINRHYKYIAIISNTKDVENPKANKNFPFNNLQDLYKPTLQLTDNLLGTTVELYYESQRNLIEKLESLVSLGFLENWKELEDLCLEYILNIKNSDVSNFILAQQNTFAKDEKLSDFASKMIKNHTGEVKPENGNLITPYIYLYYQIKESIEFVEKYKELAEQIKKVEM